MLTFLTDNMLLFFLIALFAIMFRLNSKVKETHIVFFYLPLLIAVLLAFFDHLELSVSEDSSRRTLRILFSVIGYTLRPAAALSLLYAMSAYSRHPLLLAVPEILNFLIHITAFFCPLAFGFDENYHFVRGPLGYTSFIVGGFYILLLIIHTVRRFQDNRKYEGWVLVLCVACICLATLVDTFTRNDLLCSAIALTSGFYYLYLHSIVSDRDILTGLFKRETFFSDVDRWKEDITAVASLDMNRLKQINDTQGHAAGDIALQTIGSVLTDFSDRNIYPYRMGGDEFTLIFFGVPEEKVRICLCKIQQAVQDKGYSIAAGYACRAPGCTMQDMIRLSDDRMYNDKRLKH